MRVEAAARIAVVCGFCSLALFLGCDLLPVTGSTVSAVTPTEGTIGTEIVITGSDLGNATGRVLVGTAEAEVVSWTDTEVVAKVAGSLAPGEYDVTVRPWLVTPLVYSSFTVVEPQLNASTFHPRFLSGGETVTVTGKYLGNDAGTVRLENRRGEAAQVEVSSWSMESITFQVPTGLTGMWSLVVSNEVAEATEHSWCTFEACPEGASREPAAVSLVGVAHETKDTPAPIQFEGVLWVLSAGGDTDLIADGYTNLQEWDNMPDPPGKSYTTPAPVIVNGILWLFSTAKDGTIEYFKYDSDDKVWSDPVKVPNVSTENNCPVTVAYNDADSYDRIELFYYSGGKIYRTYTDNRGGSWSTPASVVSANWGPSAMFWESAVYWDSTNSVTVSVPNATILAYPYSSGIKVSYLQDGTVIHTVTKSTSSTLEYFRPYLVDLGEDYLAVVCSDLSCEPGVRKISKDTGKWESTWRPISNPKTCCWSTTGAIGVQKVADANSVGGYRYDTYFYLLWGKNDGGLFDDDEWTISQIEYLGYYVEPEDPVACNLADSVEDTFYLWPLIGIVDAPPFVANGTNIAGVDCDLYSCTRAEFGTEASSYVTLGGSASAGLYVETGEHCPAKVEISSEVNASINTEKTLTSKREDELYRDLEGTVMAFYLTPEFQTHTYEWFDNGDTATGKYFYVVEMTKLDMTKKTFGPSELPVDDALYVSEPYWDDFTSHVADTDLARLDTYSYSPTETAWFSSSGDWAKSSPGAIVWTGTTATETEGELDIEFKVGKGGKIGGGVEGSFTLHTSLSTELTAEAQIHLINTDASNASRGDVESFHAIGYWLAPNADGYWVPRNRQGMGDKPWFITYQVTGIQMFDD